MGFYIFLSNENFFHLVKEEFDKIEADVMNILQEKMFLFEGEREVFIEKAMIVYRENKKYIFSGTSLHIFVLTNSCNMCCVYCQAQDSGQ